MKRFYSLVVFCSFACMPLCNTESFLGNDCKVMQVPTGTHEFDLNPLYRTRSNYRIISDSDNGQVFLVNICGPLTEPCNGQRNVSVCLIQANGTQIAIGHVNKSVTYDNGRIQFDLQGDKCTSGKNSTVTIIMMCDDTATVDTGPQLLGLPALNCTFYFIWYNRFSCTPHKEVRCNAVDAKGRIYDLSQLTLHSSNYIALMNDNKRRPGLVKIELNVCHSVVSGHGIACPYNSGVCVPGLWNSINGSTSRNLGDVTSGPYFENEILMLSYTEGDICTESDVPDIHTSSVIRFICDPNKHDTHPKISSEFTRPCRYHFIWETSAACPIELKIGSDQSINADNEANDCIFTNPVTKSQLDLHSLMGKEIQVTVNSNQTLKLSICGPLKNSSCGEDSSSCLAETNTSAGNANTKYLTHQLGSPVPYLYYVNGSLCKNGTSWSTAIMFDCGSEDSNPEFVAVIDCQYVIRWYTHLVCERKIQCTAVNKGQVVDLSPLISATNNYKISVGTTEVVLNVCQPLLSPSSYNCPTGSAACVVDGSRKNMSLGYPFDSPIENIEGNIVLSYLNGSPCPSNPAEKLSSSIVFICDKNVGKGRPMFKQVVDSCLYEFEWRTRFVCVDEEEELTITNNNCMIHDKASQLSIDLKPLHEHGSFEAVGFHGQGKKTYMINLCGLHGVCEGGAGVCEVLKDSWLSYGQIVNLQYSFEDRRTKISYSHGAMFDESGKEFCSAEVWLECDAEAGIGVPRVLLETNECYVLFEWKTEVACWNGTEKPRTSSVPVGISVGVVAFVLGICIVLGLYYFKLLPKCPPFSTNVFGLMRNRRDQVIYSRQHGEDTEDWSSF